MEYREIVAVTGLSGLFQLVTTKSDGAIVRSIADKSTKFISARQHNVTPLESIEVYTTGDNVRLHEVFQKMQEQEATHALADTKSDNNTIKKYFMTVFPIMDEERVYVSDMKKMLKWYEILKANDLLRFEAPQEEAVAAPAENAASGEEPAETGEDAGDDKPAKKARAKKAADTDAAEGEDKPKKAAKKKKADEGEDAGEDKPKKAGKKKSEE